ncbi:uncharacterized protein CIMG_03612 [Coccidioides immitis RS]|uniref:Uncharacterized protein n=4 Tax=Coccidioides immitis TaxID=5501 RepID=J3KBR8_COCIM|nr:uncharacterized protein CIMG_03612 [Coccidioides immitis RS]KMP07831.1 hypothetical protein CIRG_07512 [Coccidioides immitis RMSCC 2394]KMU71708.1 hypothetical protein CISG_00018 [Coccidioides immitis RMSCC 3703]KMU85015.1 hypothetical protein CIHG_02798 [Coccidioides immitis H538.4]TPX19631.1 hypothetical protein DIZ76_017423 [Coccidioides immitis]EAS32588.3 hypothetical protein CIMG_03612 [Coccidioides immitis RS]
MNRGTRVILSTKRACASLRARPQASPNQLTHEVNTYRFGHSEASRGKDSESHHKEEREPHCFEPASFSKEFDEHIPSNKARPTLSDAYQHSGVDAKHPKRPEKKELSEEDSRKLQYDEEEVKKHNEDVERRYDRAISQVSDKGDKGELGTLDTEVDDKGHIRGE